MDGAPSGQAEQFPLTHHTDAARRGTHKRASDSRALTSRLQRHRPSVAALRPTPWQPSFRPPTV
eukprot:1095284-Prymnesium_polylepis.1